MTPFWAMSGFREIDQTLELMDRLGLEGLKDLVKTLQRQPNPSGLKAFFRSLMSLPDRDKREVTTEAVARAAALGTSEPAFPWVVTLAEAYPGDIFYCH